MIAKELLEVEKEIMDLIDNLSPERAYMAKLNEAIAQEDYEMAAFIQQRMNAECGTKTVDK